MERSFPGGKLAGTPLPDISMGNAADTVRAYRFGPFTLDARTGELTGTDGRTSLREQPLRLLLALLERPGELVTREELTSRLWPSGVNVDFDRGLNKAINNLRDALGDSVEQPTFIETLPRKGYRFIAPVTFERIRAAGEDGRVTLPAMLRDRPVAVAVALIVIAAGVMASRGWMTSRGTALRISSVAVLPLENLSEQPEGDYLADGITDALITDLARLGSLRVTSRTSVMRYRGTKKSVGEIGHELNVDAIVEGTVARAGNRVRITAQLIQVSTDMHLWAESYERDIGEILDLQSAVATTIARQVNGVVKPLDRPRRVNPEAYGLYLKGRHFFYQYTSDGWRQAIDHYARAIEIDPQFAPAYSALADAYIVSGAYSAIPSEEALILGKQAATKALELDGTLASAHYVLATAYAWFDWDWTSADREFQRAIELNPNDSLGRNWHGGYLSLRGRHDEAIAEHQRAVELDPLSLIANANLTRALYWAHRYKDAIVQARKTLDVDPHFSVALFWLEGAMRHDGQFKEAVALRQAAASTPEEAADVARLFAAGGFDAILRQTAERFAKAGAPVVAARCYSQLGDKEQAFRMLEACAARRCLSLVNLPVEPDFDPLRMEPRFQALVAMVQGPAAAIRR